MNFNKRSETFVHNFIEVFKSELLLNLPGVEAHVRLAPEMRIEDIRTGSFPTHAQESAVLILLYPINNRIYTAVILRNEYEGAHSGQISLPGGKVEPKDISFMHTALREASEEIGIIPSEVEIIGQLSKFYVRPSNFIVYPFIAFSPERPEFIPDRSEVQRIIEIDISEELDYNKIVIRNLTFRGNLSFAAPGFEVGGEFLWGATAMILSEFIEITHNVYKKIEKQ